MQEVAGDFARLIRQAKSYDREAFADLYRLAITPVYRYLSARLSSVEEVEDLTQEVFMAALTGIQGLRAEEEAGFLSWLFQIARHKLADHLRRKYRRPATSLDGAGETKSDLPQPDEVAEEDEERAELRQVLDELTAEQREVILCKYVLDYDNEHTGRVVGKNANAVNQLHHRALASLRRLLTESERVK